MKKIILIALMTLLLVSCGKADEAINGDNIIPDENTVEASSGEVNETINPTEESTEDSEETSAEKEEIVVDEKPTPSESSKPKAEVQEKQTETPVVPVVEKKEEVTSQEKTSETPVEKEETTDIEISAEVENLFNELLNDTDQSINQIENGQ